MQKGWSPFSWEADSLRYEVNVGSESVVTMSVRDFKLCGAPVVVGRIEGFFDPIHKNPVDAFLHYIFEQLNQAELLLTRSNEDQEPLQWVRSWFRSEGAPKLFDLEVTFLLGAVSEEKARQAEDALQAQKDLLENLKRGCEVDRETAEAILDWVCQAPGTAERAFQRLGVQQIEEPQQQPTVNYRNLGSIWAGMDSGDECLAFVA